MSGEELALGLRTNHRHAGALRLILRIVETAFFQFQSADGLSLRIEAIYGHLERAVLMLHAGLQESFRTDVADKRHECADAVYVFQGKTDLCSGLGASGLQRGASGEDAHDLHAEIRKNVANSAAESCSVCQQEHHGSNAPCHAQHGERGASAVVAHRLIRLP